MVDAPGHHPAALPRPPDQDAADRAVPTRARPTGVATRPSCILARPSRLREHHPPAHPAGRWHLRIPRWQRRRHCHDSNEHGARRRTTARSTVTWTGSARGRRRYGRRGALAELQLGARVHTPDGLGLPFDHLALRVDTGATESLAGRRQVRRLQPPPTAARPPGRSARPAGSFRITLTADGDPLEVTWDGEPAQDRRRSRTAWSSIPSPRQLAGRCSSGPWSARFSPPVGGAGGG